MKSQRILVVDDNPTNLKLVSDVLEFEGYKILKASDAEEAQAVLANTLPDLILMDIALPGMDGLTLTRQIKADERGTTLLLEALEVLRYVEKKDGHYANTAMTVKLIQPIAMEENLKFAIREGGRTVGAGRVTKILK